MNDPALIALAARLECVHDPRLDELYPAHFAGWVAAEDTGRWLREDILDPTGSTANPVNAAGITEKFRGINPDLPVDAIARTALAMEDHTARKLVALLAVGGRKEREAA
jgi:2-methylcitrate dehydratase PrpD